MVRLAVLAAAFLAVGAQEQSIAPSLPVGQCLHGSSERANERSRRQQAVTVAHQINLAEMRHPRLPFQH
jgi:hypothetical protein